MNTTLDKKMLEQLFLHIARRSGDLERLIWFEQDLIHQLAPGSSDPGGDARVTRTVRRYVNRAWRQLQQERLHRRARLQLAIFDADADRRRLAAEAGASANAERSGEANGGR